MHRVEKFCGRKYNKSNYHLNVFVYLYNIIDIRLYLSNISGYGYCNTQLLQSKNDGLN